MRRSPLSGGPRSSWLQGRVFYPAAFRDAARGDTGLSVTVVVQISATCHIFEKFFIVVGVVCGEKKEN